MLLGRLGPRCSHVIYTKEDDVIAESAAGRQPTGNLEFGLPLEDMKPSIQLELFLPRIIQLALYAGMTIIKLLYVYISNIGS